MNRRVCRGIIAAVLFSLITAQPLAFGAERRAQEPKDTRSTVTKVLKQIGKLFGITVAEDLPGPPKP
jgi:hypothetical protein